jgi:hypothetical protein
LIIQAGADPPPLYACPECFSLFPEDSVTDRSLPHEQQLSAEHVPPETVGGRELLLTCKPCNNRAGTRLDADANRAEQMRQFVAGNTIDLIRLKVTFPDVGWVAADLQVSEDRVWIVTTKDKGAPTQHVDALRGALKEREEEGIPKGTRVRWEATSLSHSRPAAETSWLRAAYLATAAQFGYCVIRRRRV